MLLQSHDGAIHILPALPSEWKEGEITGLKARGGFEIDIKWINGKLSEATIYSKIGGNCRLRSYVPLQGKGLIEAKGENPNTFYQKAKIIKPLIHCEDSLYLEPQKEVFEYDVQMQKGAKIIISGI